MTTPYIAVESQNPESTIRDIARWIASQAKTLLAWLREKDREAAEFHNRVEAAKDRYPAQNVCFTHLR